ncbi:MAG: hypothetical protein DVB28_001644 [Verrucomicrobia bacterium]|nr:MAG: hypothetical protein DVB28_001644 [Verrucomicrobiota bacterium]
MRCTAAIFFSVSMVAQSLSAAPPPVRAVQTMDQSHQLLVQGATFSQRSAVLQLASGLRQTLLQALYLPQERYPVARPLLFLLNPERSSEIQPAFQVLEDPGGLKIQIQLAPIQNHVSLQVERIILTALITELSLRTPLSADKDSQEPLVYPARWLVDAVLHKYHHPDSRFSPVQLRPVLEAGQIPPPLLLLARPENDIGTSTEEEVALARCLLWMLTNRSENRPGIPGLLKTDFTQDPLGHFRKLFPVLGASEASLNKEWTLAVAAYGTLAEIISLDGPQTQLEIERLLQLDLTEADTGRHLIVPLEQFSDFLRFPGLRLVLATRQLEWGLLQERGHFLYSAVIATYAAVCGELAQGRTAGVPRRLREATLEKESIAARLSRIHDHMNWFEAVVAPRQNTAKLREFYRILDKQPAVSDSVRRALDKAELQLKDAAEREDIARILEETQRRKIEK